MKKVILFFAIIAIFLPGVSGQNKMLNAALVFDKAPIEATNQIQSPTSSREIWDLQFEFAIEDTTQGIETDGQYIYITNYLNSNFKKYDLAGNLLEYFTIPNVSLIRDLAYDGQYFYGGNAVDNKLYVMDFNTKTLVDEITLSFPVRGIAYNPNEELFYSNNWDQSYIYEFRLTGEIVDSITATEYGYTYGYAYDGWSEGGPYLWGFSQNNNLKEAILTQYSLVTNQPTGFYKDLAYLTPDTTNIFAGGLFSHQNLVSGTVTLGGLIQGDRVFGLELDSVFCDVPVNLTHALVGFDVNLYWAPPANQEYFLESYNIYRNDTMIQNNPASDTFFEDLSLSYGDYSYYVTALYHDDLGAPTCESEPSNIVQFSIQPPAATTLGGNVIAGSDKMYYGHVNAYLFENNVVGEMFTSVINDTLGYYFFLPYANKNYYIQAIPKELSVFADGFIPTYFGGALHWEDASSIYLDDNIYDANIDMTPLAENDNGIGRLHGTVAHQNRSGQINNAQDMLVLLFNASKECVAYQFTDESGDFDFPELALNNYSILVEVVGKAMDPIPFVLNENVTSIEDISFVITEDEVQLGMDENLPQYVNSISELYPNPAANSTRFEINLSKAAPITVCLYDAKGVIVSSERQQLNHGVNSVQLAVEHLSAGIYYVKIDFENDRSLIRKVMILD
jgi:type IX secretion system substrate protein